VRSCPLRWTPIKPTLTLIDAIMAIAHWLVTIHETGYLPTTLLRFACGRERYV
jgi:hypothetical protein